jgi:hypothetical protein
MLGIVPRGPFDQTRGPTKLSSSAIALQFKFNQFKKTQSIFKEVQVGHGRPQ